MSVRRKARASRRRLYSLIGPAAEQAEAQGLVAAEWYHTDLPRKRMKELMRRRDWPATRDTAIWLSLLAGTGFGACWFWGSWACVPFFLCYGVLYGTVSQARWHESGHGTAFKTSWLNDALYQLTSFMYGFEPTYTRWTHSRHHTDTYIVGRDPEQEPRPPYLGRLTYLNVIKVWFLGKSVAKHALGRIDAAEETFIPEGERSKVVREAQVWVAIYLGVLAASILLRSPLPLLLVGTPLIYGGWLDAIVSYTQHAALAENVLDHRLNSRTVYMNPILRFVYWNMNYHVEHHMFPMVPYHALPALHAAIKHDLPKPCSSLLAAYREIIPAQRRQYRDPEYYIRRELPASAKPFRADLHEVVFATE